MPPPAPAGALSVGGFAASACTALLLSTFFLPSARAQHLDGTACRLATLLPFTDERPSIVAPHGDPAISYGYGKWPDQATLGKASFSLLAAAEMARRHFNDRDGAVVPELATELEGCDVQLVAGDDDNSLWVFDSGYSRSRTVDQLLPLVSDPSSAEKVCAVIGPIDPKAHGGASVLTESLRVPELGFATIDRRLERVDAFPTFLRTIPAATDFSAKIANLVGRDIWKREYVAIVYDQSDYGEQFEDALEGAEDLLGYATVTEHVVEGDDESIYGSLGEAKDKGFRTILLVTDRPSFLNDIARIAEELEMLGDNDYFWLISGAAFPPAMRDVMQYEADSPIDKMLRGAALFTNYDPFVYDPGEDAFLRAWRQQDESMATYVANELQPLDSDGQQYYIPESATYFQTETPTEYASFIYDSVIAAGMGACRAASLPALEEDNAHYRGIQASKFSGASGVFSMMGNTRDPSGTRFGVYNVRPGPIEGISRSYETVLTSIWDSSYTTNAYGEEVEGGAWRNVDDAEFIFYDGSTEQPTPLRTVANDHTLSDSIQITGLFLSSLAMFLCLATGAFVFAKRKHKHIKASQPEFCLMLCAGATLVAASLIFVSFDESDGFSEERLSAMCTTAPWFFVVGYLTMFCALFSQLWRLSKVLSIRRQQVQIKNVLGPFAGIILCSLIVLTVWTIIDPFIWTRNTISGIEMEDGEAKKNTDEQLETYGSCASVNYGIAPFLVPLGLLFALVIGLTASFSWKLKGVSDDFADSKLIFFGIFTHIETWMLGVPILIITNSVSKDAFYFCVAALAFIFSVSLVACVIWPKIYFYLRDTYFGGPGRSNAASSLGIHGSTRVSGLNINPDAGRMIELESQVSKLKMQLEEKDSEVRRLSTSVSGDFEAQLSQLKLQLEEKKAEVQRLSAGRRTSDLESQESLIIQREIEDEREANATPDTADLSASPLE